MCMPGYAEPQQSSDQPSEGDEQAAPSSQRVVQERVSPAQPDPLEEALDAGHLEARSVSVSFTSSRSPYHLVAPTPATLKRRQQMIVLAIVSLHLK